MTRRLALSFLLAARLLDGAVAGGPAPEPIRPHEPAPARTASISTPLFADLERMSRIVDISYCVGNSGVRKPFRCLSRCSEFPELSLVSTWNTGILLSDSCGYMAVDHGSEPGQDGAPYGPDGALIVAFRGTYSITNTVVDLSTVPQRYVPYPAPDDGDDGNNGPPKRPRHECANCTVHMGFFESWRNAREVVLPELKALRARHPTLPVHLVGHSLGGAVACLAALELKLSLGWDQVRVTTFGEPRVGNHQLARFIDRAFGLDAAGPDPASWPYRRVTHSQDPVPLLPWDEWGYSSHAGEVYITKPSLPPTEDDVRPCVGDRDPACSTGGVDGAAHEQDDGPAGAATLPTRLKLWQLFFAHRDYFWRLGLCVPGGDPANWGRDAAAGSEPDEL
ncbi:hypothetical protein CDD83_2472 [Cordyceps sp. RAO-2017]|nr:hypothetical protein CDD83_2472 [Cordyceps sp. RAO-2017]